MELRKIVNTAIAVSMSDDMLGSVTSEGGVTTAAKVNPVFIVAKVLGSDNVKTLCFGRTCTLIFSSHLSGLISI